MKKIIILIVIFFNSYWIVNAQKENGVVYSEHPAIDKTKAMWDAFAKGDKQGFVSYLSDSILLIENGVIKKIASKNLAGMVGWWQNITNFTIKDDATAFSDAIEYPEAGLFVQDWLRLSGIHKETAIALDIPVHDIYHFNEEGKIDLWTQYYTPTVFDEINNSNRTIESGTIYNNHPFIVSARKCIHAYASEDINEWTSYYSPKATFWKSSFKAGKVINLEEKIKENNEVFANFDNLTFQQEGYPDCLYYEKEDFYTVNSWWRLSFTTKDGKKQSDIMVLISQDFDKEGKIIREMDYMGNN